MYKILCLEKIFKNLPVSVNNNMFFMFVDMEVVKTDVKMF